MVLKVVAEPADRLLFAGHAAGNALVSRGGAARGVDHQGGAEVRREDDVLVLRDDADEPRADRVHRVVDGRPPAEQDGGTDAVYYQARSLDAERQPFIAAHTAHPTAQWLGGSLPAGPATEGAPAWCARYELFPFGGLNMYAPRALESDMLERRARQAHMLFIGLPNTRDARHAALGSYYRRQFNRDTARMAAMSLSYRMHLAGLNLISWRLYGVPDEEARLGAAYSRWLKDDDHLQTAVRDEHVRRCRMLLSLGWRAATPDTVAQYVRRGNPGHILYPAKLDPFIRPWEEIEELRYVIDDPAAVTDPTVISVDISYNGRHAAPEEYETVLYREEYSILNSETGEYVPTVGYTSQLLLRRPDWMPERGTVHVVLVQRLASTGELWTQEFDCDYGPD